MTYIGLDWGGTKIEIVALDDDGAELLRERVPTPRQDYRGCISAAAGLVARAEKTLGQSCSVGVGIPGSISPFSGLVQNGNSTWLNGKPLHQDLQTALGRSIRIENDANCFALSEARDGAARGAEMVFAVIIGTGCGAGLAINGRPRTGIHRIAGEWGHNPLPIKDASELNGPACFCGRSGCIETYVSGTGFARDYRQSTGEQCDAEDVMHRMRGGDEAARRAYHRLIDRLGRSLAGVVNILDPDVIVFGGGLSKVDELYADLPGAVARYVFCDRFTTPVLKARHGDSSGVRGAAWLWL